MWLRDEMSCGRRSLANSCAAVLLLAVASGCLSRVASAAAQGAAPFELKGLSLGMSREQLEPVIGQNYCRPVGVAQHCSPTETVIFEHDERKVSFAGQQVSLVAILHDGAIAAITVNDIPREEYETVRDAMASKYGRWKVEERIGLRRVAIWDQGDALLRVYEQVGFASTDGGVELLSKTSLRAMEREAVEVAKDDL